MTMTMMVLVDVVVDIGTEVAVVACTWQWTLLEWKNS